MPLGRSPSTRARFGAAWLFAEQATYSLSNLAAMVVGGRVLSPANFGRLALGLLMVNSLTGLSRALVAEPRLIVTRSQRDEPIRLVMSSRLLEVAVLIGITGLVVTHTASWSWWWILAFLGVAYVSVVQDALRLELLAAGSVAASSAANLTWLLVVLVGVLGPAAQQLDGPTSVLTLWGLGAAASIIQMLPVRPRDAKSFAPSLRQSLTSAVEFLANSGGSVLASAALWVLGGPADFGVVRAAISLLGPVGVVSTGLVTRAVTRARSCSGLANLLRADRAALGGAAGVSLVLAGSVLIVPNSLGSQLIGEAWPPKSLVLGLGISVALQVVGTWALACLRRDLRWDDAAFVRLCELPILVTGVALCYAFGGLRWVPVGYCIAYALTAVVALRLLANQDSRRSVPAL